MVCRLRCSRPERCNSCKLWMPPATGGLKRHCCARDLRRPRFRTEIGTAGTSLLSPGRQRCERAVPAATTMATMSRLEMKHAQPTLFAQSDPELPAGFRYQSDLLSADEERVLVE